jgi:hypothetical protein
VTFSFDRIVRWKVGGVAKDVTGRFGEEKTERAT